MAWPIHDRLLIPFNADVVRFLGAERPSAHSDVASELELAVSGFTGVTTICPEPAAYAWVAACTGSGRIFALALGQSAFVVRLPAARTAESLADRGTPFGSIGPEWICFDPFEAEVSTAAARARLRHWCEVAYRAAGS